MISPGADLACGTEPPVAAGESPSLAAAGEVGPPALRDSLLALIKDDEPLTDAQEEALLRLVEERMAQAKPYGLPEAFQYLTERADWLQREIRNGGDLRYLQLRREECLYVRDSIRRTSEAVNALPAPPAVKGV